MGWTVKISIPSIVLDDSSFLFIGLAVVRMFSGAYQGHSHQLPISLDQVTPAVGNNVDLLLPGTNRTLPRHLLVTTASNSQLLREDFQNCGYRILADDLEGRLHEDTSSN